MIKLNDIFFKTLNFMWLSIGSIIFFKDCQNKLSDTFDKFMWSILIINWFLMIFILLININEFKEIKIKEKQQRELRELQLVHNMLSRCRF